MEEHSFSNSNIDLACEDVGVFLTSVGVEKREALRIKLTLEEILLEYQAKFGEEVYGRNCLCIQRRTQHPKNQEKSKLKGDLNYEKL